MSIFWILGTVVGIVGAILLISTWESRDSKERRRLRVLLEMRVKWEHREAVGAYLLLVAVLLLELALLNL
jgi:hypothetical protein